jgi:hypothetical protein
LTGGDQDSRCRVQWRPADLQSHKDNKRCFASKFTRLEDFRKQFLYYKCPTIGSFSCIGVSLEEISNAFWLSLDVLKPGNCFPFEFLGQTEDGRGAPGTFLCLASHQFAFLIFLPSIGPVKPAQFSHTPTRLDATSSDYASTTPTSSLRQALLESYDILSSFSPAKSVLLRWDRKICTTYLVKELPDPLCSTVQTQ